MTNRFDLSPGDLATLLAGEPAYRTGQLRRALLAGREPPAMTDLPLALRRRLEETLPPAARLVRELASGDRATVKWLWELHDGARVETVLMRYPDRATVCVSSQAGCAMACPFCATGQAGFQRHLSAGEIVEQVVRATSRAPDPPDAPDLPARSAPYGPACAIQREGARPGVGLGPHAREEPAGSVPNGQIGGAPGGPVNPRPGVGLGPHAREEPAGSVPNGQIGGAPGGPVNPRPGVGLGPHAREEPAGSVPNGQIGGAPGGPVNIVFMGMGEPLANYDAVWGAVEVLHGELGISARHLTVSTVGVVPGIRRLATERLPVNLAVSLHAANDALRDELVPLNRRYPIAEVVSACQAWLAAKNRRLSFEWALIDGVNDRPSDASELARLALPLRAHVNLIPLNPTPGYPVRGTPADGVRAFRDRLRAAGVNATVRRNRGTEIDAACGQLAARATARL